jgi:hypothetical protein
LERVSQGEAFFKKWGAIYKVGRGDQIKFWHDVWMDKVPLRVSYQEFYNISSDPHALFEDLLAGGEWQVNFSRELDIEQMERWDELSSRLQGVCFSDESDTVVWALKKDGQFTTRSLYKFLSFGGVRNKRLVEIWKTNVPLKVRIFMWQMFQDKIKSADQLKKWNWKGDFNCQLCGRKEDLNHIMFTYVSSRFIWITLKEMFGWQCCHKLFDDFVLNWVGNKSPKRNSLFWFGLGVVCWALWKVRNKMTIEKKMVKSPSVIIVVYDNEFVWE